MKSYTQVPYVINREEVVIKPLEVQVLHGNFEEAFRRFKSLVQKEKVVSLFKQKMAYEKPSEKKRRKSREAAERNFLAEAREKQMISGEWDKKQEKKEQKRQQKQEAAQQKRRANEE